MSQCNPGYCCCGCANLSAKLPTTLCTSAPSLPGHGSNIWCSFMSDTVGVVWRGFSGTVDPWTKNNLVVCGAAGLQKASGGLTCVNAATASACKSATCYLKSIKADPSQAACGLKNSFDSFLADTKSLLIWIAIGAIVLILVSNYVTRPVR